MAKFYTRGNKISEYVEAEAVAKVTGFYESQKKGTLGTHFLGLVANRQFVSVKITEPDMINSLYRRGINKGDIVRVVGKMWSYASEGYSEKDGKWHVYGQLYMSPSIVKILMSLADQTTWEGGPYKQLLEAQIVGTILDVEDRTSRLEHAGKDGRLTVARVMTHREVERRINGEPKMVWIDDQLVKVQGWDNGKGREENPFYAVRQMGPFVGRQIKVIGKPGVDAFVTKDDELGDNMTLLPLGWDLVGRSAR